MQTAPTEGGYDAAPQRQNAPADSHRPLNAHPENEVEGDKGGVVHKDREIPVGSLQFPLQRTGSASSFR
ncbi:MAG: hypothetical protein ABSB67_18810 [Bryobacteraceae bacterium]|jgi:hypothetical protein